MLIYDWMAAVMLFFGLSLSGEGYGDEVAALLGCLPTDAGKLGTAGLSELKCQPSC